MFTENTEPKEEQEPQQLFTRAELVKFGEYLLSQERYNRIEENWSEGDNVPLEVRLKQIYHADVENFIALLFA